MLQLDQQPPRRRRYATRCTRFAAVARRISDALLAPLLRRAATAAPGLPGRPAERPDTGDADARLPSAAAPGPPPAPVGTDLAHPSRRWPGGTDLSPPSMLQRRSWRELFGFRTLD